MPRFSKIALLIISCVIVLWSCKRDDYVQPNHKGNNSSRDNHDNQPVVDPYAWKTAEIDSVLSGDTSKGMSVLVIDNYVDSVILRIPSMYIKPDSTDTILNSLIHRMYLAMRDSLNPGVGIAAPQVGINRNIIWVERADKTPKIFECYLNPVIVDSSDYTSLSNEGCLSIPFPALTGTVERPYGIFIEYDTPKGEHKTEVLINKNVTRIFCHEIDHLHGTLYIDYLQ